MNMPVYPTTQPKVKSRPGQHQPMMAKEKLARLARQLIPTINTIHLGRAGEAANHRT